MKYRAAFRRWLKHKTIAFDTSFLLPVLNDIAQKDHPNTRLLDLIHRRSLRLLTSTVTLLEILVHPYRLKDLETVNRYFGYFNSEPLLEIAPLTSQVADRAAEFRARYGLKTPDAIQLATAVTGGATLFLTQDRDFRKQREIEVGFL